MSYTRKELFEKVAAGELTPEQAEERFTGPQFRVLKSGAVGLFRFQRRPLILYAAQWERLRDLLRGDDLDTFLEANADAVSRRDQDTQDTQDE